MTRLIFTIIANLALLLAFGVSFAKGTSKDPLVKIHADIVEDYPHIPHISRAELQARLTLPQNDLIIFDTRPAKEYNVSHIKGAIQIDPKMNPQDFQAKFGEKLSGKTVIVYCSVGRRSTRFGDHIAEAISHSGIKHIYNLEGGLFGWHNDGRPLENASGATTAIHPYNPYWGRLIENKEQMSYSPKE